MADMDKNHDGYLSLEEYIGTYELYTIGLYLSDPWYHDWLLY